MIEKVNPVENNCRPAIDRYTGYRSNSTIEHRKKILALTVVVIMIAATVAMIAPLVKQADNTLNEELPATTEAVGPRETTYTMSNFFESYEKPDGVTKWWELGRHNRSDPMVLNSWHTLRPAGYPEYVIRSDSYPFLLSSEAMTPTPVVDPAFYVYSFFRYTVDADNVTEIGTDNGEDMYFIPEMGSPSQDGGWVNASFYLTYCTGDDLNDIRTRLVTHYGNRYYDIFWNTFPNLLDDGWWNELQGEITFTRQAANKYLGLAGAGSLIDQYNTDQATIDTAWQALYNTEGGDGGTYDITACYEFPNDVRYTHTSLDATNSTADFLTLRLYSVSWGNEMLFVRYLEACNVSVGMQLYTEDWYLNLTIGPEKADIDSDGYTVYCLTANKDPNAWTGAWTIESQTADYMTDTTGYISTYNPYDPENYPAIVHPSYLPGTTNFGEDCSFYYTPTVWNLTADEQLAITLPSTDVLGIKPYQGASDTLDAAKQTELLSNSYWGTMVLGHCNPSESANYDPATKTITINGPLDAWASRVPNSGDSSLLANGVPIFFFAVSNASEYQIEILDQATWQTVATPLNTVTYNLRVIAKNSSANTVTDWNGTVDLTVEGGTYTLGDSHHTYSASENGNWTTTIVFDEVSTYWVNATDENWTLDVTGASGAQGVQLIPEFPMLLIPIIGIIAIFLVFRTRRRQE